MVLASREYPETHSYPQRLNSSENKGQYPRKKGLLSIGTGFAGLEGLDGGRDRDRTCDPLDVNEVLSR